MAHRKVDVDQFPEEDDDYVEQRTPSISLPDLENVTNEKVNAVRQALARGDHFVALQAAISQPPYGPSQLENLKATCMQNVYAVLSAVRNNDIPTLVQKLNQNEIDILLKYLFRGMSSPVEFNSAILLTWHEKAVEVGGVGSIARCLTDKLTV